MRAARKEGEISFLQGCGPWEANHAPVDGPTHIRLRAAQLGLSGLQADRQTNTERHEVGEMDTEGVMCRTGGW